MATILESLRSVSGYPIPQRTIEEKAQRRGLFISEEASPDVLEDSAYRLAVADLMVWLSYAPNVSQGGQSYSFSEDQRIQLRSEAYAVYRMYGDPGDTTQKPRFGYMGSRL